MICEPTFRLPRSEFLFSKSSVVNECLFPRNCGTFFRRKYWTCNSPKAPGTCDKQLGPIYSQNQTQAISLCRCGALLKRCFFEISCESFDPTMFARRLKACNERTREVRLHNCVLPRLNARKTRGWCYVSSMDWTNGQTTTTASQPSL